MDMTHCEICGEIHCTPGYKDHPNYICNTCIEKVKELQGENSDLLKQGTNAMNGLFLLSESIIKRGLVDDKNCSGCTKEPKFIQCLVCQPSRWLKAGEEMSNDPNTKAWAEANTPEKVMDLILGESQPKQEENYMATLLKKYGRNRNH